MTPRSFWIVLVRIMGLYLIFETMYVIIPYLTQTLYIIRRPDSDFSYLESVWGLIIIAGTYYLLFRYCIFHTEVVVDKLNLDKGFIEEKFEFNIHRSTVLRIAVIVIGALMFADSLPTLGREILVYYQTGMRGVPFKDNIASPWIIFAMIKIFVGLFMMTASRLVVNIIELKRKKPAQTEE